MTDKAQFTHGSSAQRIRWFRRGFDGGDARNCDTFAEPAYSGSERPPQRNGRAHRLELLVANC